MCNCSETAAIASAHRGKHSVTSPVSRNIGSVQQRSCRRCTDIVSEKRQRLHALRRHLARLERRRQRLDNLSRRYSRVRVGLVLTALGILFLLHRSVGEGIAWLAVAPIALVFLVVVSTHKRVKDSIGRLTIWCQIKSTHVARLTLDWPHIPLSPVSAPDPQHPFEADLNLTGERSLHQLLDTTMTWGGSARLCTWLRHPLTQPEQILARQALVRELIPRLTFRDRLALNSTLVATSSQTRWDGEILRDWLEQPPASPSLWPWILLLSLLSGTTLALGVLYALSLLPAFWIVSFVIYVVLYHGKHRALDNLFTEAFRLETVLHHFRAVLLYLETYPYDRTTHLANLCAPYWQADSRPSTRLRTVARIAGAASIQKGNLVGPLINAIVPWDLYFAHRFMQCKADLRTLLPQWLDTWYELEALNALAHFGYLNPNTVFPQFLPLSATTGQPVLQAQELGHPLLPDDQRVCNPFVLERLGQMVLMTGSNMSGKSTFLRTVGINLCLALNGAPVQAASWQSLPFRLFTCMSVSDSVTDGISYFYAEVKRLKALLEALETPHPVPLFFLIDEIFRGTNNRERLIGSQAYVQALTGRYGAGLVSTHDLDLIKLADASKDIDNAHFREQVVDGRMVFDYQLRPGPCPTTNALTIMRLEGLPVPPTIDTDDPI